MKRYLRGARLPPIGGGTGEALQAMIAKALSEQE
jgi:alkylation response protein AidB-like acyl-CoA dehydrogenase